MTIEAPAAHNELDNQTIQVIIFDGLKTSLQPVSPGSELFQALQNAKDEKFQRIKELNIKRSDPEIARKHEGRLRSQTVVKQIRDLIDCEIKSSREEVRVLQGEVIKPIILIREGTDVKCKVGQFQSEEEEHWWKFRIENQDLNRYSEPEIDMAHQYFILRYKKKHSLTEWEREEASRQLTTFSDNYDKNVSEETMDRLVPVMRAISQSFSSS